MKMTPSEMHARANDFRGKADGMSDLQSQVKTVVDNVLIDWESDAANAFNDVFQFQFLPALRNLTESLQDLATRLDTSADNYSTADDSSKSLWQ